MREWRGEKQRSRNLGFSVRLKCCVWTRCTFYWLTEKRAIIILACNTRKIYTYIYIRVIIMAIYILFPDFIQYSSSASLTRGVLFSFSFSFSFSLASSFNFWLFLFVLYFFSGYSCIMFHSINLLTMHVVAIYEMQLLATVVLDVCKVK